MYERERFMLLTQHGKERVLAPIMRERLGADLEVVGGFDTDTLGTFTREVPRVSSQLDAARRKASIALERSGGRIGLGSEGSFVPGPFGFGSWNIEVVVLLDRVRGIEVVGKAHGPGLHAHGLVRSVGELREFAARAGFPDHGLTIRPEGPGDPRLRKGIRDGHALEAAFAEAMRGSSDGVFVESDLRAHQHPSRMETIARAGRDLAERLASACPGCGSPGFGHLGNLPGKPCSACGLPTDEARAESFGCVRCAHREERALAGEADPSRCGHCNP